MSDLHTKLHMFDKNPDLKRSKWPYSVIVISPPAGNRSDMFYSVTNSS